MSVQRIPDRRNVFALRDVEGCWPNHRSCFTSIRAGKEGAGVFGSNDDAYKKIVEHFLVSGNRVNDYDIARVEPSKYAIPTELLKQIGGETTMTWTGFVFEMPDGKFIPFGTTFLVAFFDIPDEYTFDDVVA